MPRSDVLPVAPGSGSAAGSLALLQKQMHALGLPDWNDLRNLSRRNKNISSNQVMNGPWDGID